MTHAASTARLRFFAATEAACRAPIDAQLTEVERWVSTALVADRPPARCTQPTRLLGEVLLARLARTRKPGEFDPDRGRRLETAETALRLVLEQWHARRSHLLEWIIIVLIALDILLQW